MLSKAEVVCVSPEFLARFWPLAKPHIEAAMKHGGSRAFEPVEADVLAGRSLLWLAWNAEESAIKAWAVTELTETACVLVACAGSDRRQWLEGLETIENYARKEGKPALRIYGRPGWSRVLKQYRVRRVVLEKALQ